MAYAKEITCKLYLEGIEYPFTAVTIHEQMNAPTQAVFSVPANSRVPFLLPKTVAHLFYYIEGDYKLIFEGELASIELENSSGSRHIKLTFVGLSQNWTQVFMQSISFMYGSIADALFFGISGYLNGSTSSTAPTTSTSTMPIRRLSSSAGKKQIKDTSWFYSESYIIKSLAVILQQAINKHKNLPQVIDKFLDFIKQHNLYYPVIDRALKLNTRVKVFENTQAERLIESTVWNGFLIDELNSLPGISNLIQILQYIFQLLGYDWSELAAPYYDTSNNVKNIIIKPQLHFMMPLKCNVIYPDQIISHNFVKNLSAEPTRMQFPPMKIIIKGAETAGLTSLFSHYTPYNEVIKTKNLPHLNLTKEEKYRGLQPMIATPPSLAERAYVRLFSGGIQTDQPDKTMPVRSTVQTTTINELVEGDVKETPDYLRNLLDLKFIQQRYSTRALQINASYSPYRIIGFPGVMLDTVFPSIVGTISSIVSVIDVNGNGTQVINLAYPRLFEDGTLHAEFDPTKDAAPRFPYFYDSTYDADSIGTEHYKNIINIDEIEDGSIWAYVDETSDDVTTIDNLELPVKDEILNDGEIEARKLGLALTELKKKYAEFSTSPHIFINSHTKRRLVTEQEFWQFLGIYQDEDGVYIPSHENNYRIAEDLEVGEERAGNDGEFKTINVEVEGSYTPNSIVGKPFVKERQDKVREIL